MTREDVIRIALEVGFYDGEVDKCQLMLERFAYLVAQQERERIAQKIEQLPFGDTAASFGVYVREAWHITVATTAVNASHSFLCSASNVGKDHD